MSVDPWIDEACRVLGIDARMDVEAVLALARDVAHSLERKNAPLTSYLLGYAAASQNLNTTQIADLASKLGARAQEWSNPNG
jgi:hypothetical protein